jgi:integrating conjugative element protein (TIGR03752 family)
VGAGAKGDDRVNVVADTVEQLKNSLTSLSSQFSTQEKRLSTTTANGYEFSNEDLGIDGKNKTDPKNTSQSMTTLLPGYVSVKPLSNSIDSPIEKIFDGKNTVNNAFNNSEPLGLAPHGTIEQNGKKITLKDGKKKSLVTPHFTIDASATLMNATAMTAMIGRVPVGGRVQDPFSVKIILGDENLATNGLSIPGLKGIVFEGVATGNWNLSCVTVDLVAATFTFTDGRIQHMPNLDKNEYEGKQAGQIETQPFSSEKSKGSSGDSIGYISTPQGAPCIGGERVTDAPQQLAAVGILGMAKNYFDAKAAAETTTLTNSNLNVGTAVTGDKMKFAVGATEAGAAQTVLDFYKSHTRDSFDAIVVNPGAAVSLHITRDLYGDYNPNSRKLTYSQGDKHGSSSMD